MKQKIGELESVSLDVYRDSYGKTIIADRKRRRGYIVPEEQLKRERLFENRYSAVIGASLLVGFYYSWIGAIILFVVGMALVEFLYRKQFLPLLETVEDIDFPPRRNAYVNVSEASLSVNILMAVVALVFIVMMMINMNIQVPDIPAAFKSGDANKIILVLATFGFCIYAAYLDIQFIKALIDRRKK